MFTRRSFVVLAAISAVATLGTGCNKTGESGTTVNPDVVQFEDESPGPIEVFVESYNSMVDDPLTHFEEFNPYDRDSGHWRVEFRLNAYKGSRGLACYTDGAWSRLYVSGDQGLTGVSVDMILSRGQIFGDFIRAYASGDNQSMRTFFRTACTIFDPGVDQDDIDSLFSTMDERGLIWASGGNSLPSSKDLNIVINTVNERPDMWSAMVESRRDFVRAIETGNRDAPAVGPAQ